MTNQEFSELLGALRDHYRASLKDGNVGSFVPPEHLKAVYASLSKPARDASDDPLADLKQDARSRAHDVANNVQDQVTQATSVFVQAGPNGAHQFFNAVGVILHKTPELADDQLNALYDYAIQEVQQHPELADAAFDLMKDIKDKFQTMVDRISSLLSYAQSQEFDWLTRGPSEIKSFFGDLNSYIDTALA